VFTQVAVDRSRVESEQLPQSLESHDKSKEFAVGVDGPTVHKSKSVDVRTASGSHLESEFDLSKKAERYWINIMDVTTGQVVYKIPPEHLRKMFESALDLHV
jgi:uncharacterized FlaG/YvyC family protein